MISNLSHAWQEFLKVEIQKTYFAQLIEQLKQEYSSKTVFPPVDQLFNAFNFCPPDQVKVVIIGQDPYHAVGQAHGLCFSVPPGTKIPPSLRNIYKELSVDVEGFVPPKAGDLSGWASQGVLLMNAVLSVEGGRPGSHRHLGWETFTDAAISELSLKYKNLVFLLWGSYAHGKEKLISPDHHLILKAAHPSPLARGAFFGCRHFSQTNRYLSQHGKQPVNWAI